MIFELYVSTLLTVIAGCIFIITIKILDDDDDIDDEDKNNIPESVRHIYS